MLHHIAIIDYLQDYSVRKRLERHGKSLLFNVPLDVLSVAPPDVYGDRFCHFMLDYVINGWSSSYKKLSASSESNFSVSLN